MDLILVMKERLRDQSAEVRSLSRRFTIFGGLAFFMLLLAFVLSPQFRSTKNYETTRWHASTASQSEISSSKDLSKATTQRKLLQQKDDKTLADTKVDNIGDRHVPFLGASDLENYYSSSTSSSVQYVSFTAFLGFFLLSAVASSLFVYSIRLLMESRFICHYYSPNGQTRPNGPWQAVTYIGSSPDPQAYRAGATGGSSGFKLAVSSPTSTAVGSASSHLFLYPLSLYHFHLPFIASFILQQVAAARLWSAWLLLGLMALQGFVFIVRARVLWNVISLGTSTR